MNNILLKALVVSCIALCLNAQDHLPSELPAESKPAKTANSALKPLTFFENLQGSLAVGAMAGIVFGLIFANKCVNMKDQQTPDFPTGFLYASAFGGAALFGTGYTIYSYTK
jgi:hypothetical protein